MQTNAVSINNVCMRYNSKMQALSDVNLNIKAGSFFGLLGANGAGKSTLLNIMNSLITPTSGNVSILGIDVVKNPIVAKKYLGVVPQELNMNGFETAYNILFNQAGYFGKSKKETQEYCDYLLNSLSLWDKRNTISLRLSGGMKRRLMIARALINQPKVLLLDEPTAGVDVDVRRQMWSFIKKINQQGTTIILTTHYLEEAEALCDEIAILQKGKVTNSGSKKSLLSTLELQTFSIELTNPCQEMSVAIPCAIKLEWQDNMHLLATIKKTTSINLLMQQLTDNAIEVAMIALDKSRLETLLTNATKKC